MTGDLKKLEDCRDALRLAQTGALLHNLGKVTRQFLNNMVSENSDKRFRYQHILHLIEEDYPNLETNIPKLFDDLKERENKKVLATKTINALKRCFRLPYPFNDRCYRPGDMIEYLGQGRQDPGNKLYAKLPLIMHIFPDGSLLTYLMNRSHSGASGGEKQDICSKKQKYPDNLYKSTPFGWESQAPTLIGTDKHKCEIEKIIQNHICSDINSLNFDYFANQLRLHLEEVIADSRRPINDVTVWDIGHTGMAFLLIQAIGMMMQGKDINHDNLNKMKKKNTLFWRVLSIRLNGLDYLEGAPSLADLRVRYSLIQATLKHIRNTLEGIPVAIEIYHDENGSFYIFPNLSDEDQLTKEVLNLLESKLTVDGIKLKCSLSKKNLVNHPDDENQDKQYIGKYICEQIESEVPKTCDLKAYTAPWQSTMNREICVVCGIRPQGYGADQISDYHKDTSFYARKSRCRNICCICMHRRTGVSERWATEDLHDSTVWIDEVADKYGRVALVVGQFDLQKWEMWYPKTTNNDDFTLKSYLKIYNFGKPLKNREKITVRGHIFEWDEEKGTLIGDTKISSISEFLQSVFKQLNIKIESIQLKATEYIIVLREEHRMDVGKEHIIIGHKFRTIDKHTLVTVDEDAARKVEKTFLYDKRFMITDYLNAYEYPEFYTMARSQSFARIRRVWETTRSFWQKILPTEEIAKIRESDGGRTIGLAGPRLKIEGELKKDDSLGRYHAYELILHGIKLSVVWIPEDNRVNGYFITAKNSILIARLLGKNLPEHNKSESAIEYQKRLHEWASKKLKKEIRNTLTIEEPTGYGSQNKVWGTITIKKVTEIPESIYTPAIPILAEPRTFMALVPADKALDVVSKIKNKYEKEMGKVRNRLPLHLGVIYAPYKTPLRVILDSGRRMLKQTSPTADGWRVSALSDALPLPDALKTYSHFKKYRCLELKKDGHCAVWYVPLMMGDGKTGDIWYPYVFVQCDKDGNTPSGRKRMFEAPCPWNRDDEGNPQLTCLVHATEIQEGDIIYFTPSTLDFQWLDTSGRRFEIAYDKGHRMDIPQRPYMLDNLDILQLEIWDTFRRYLTTSQIHILYELIETKRSEWDLSDSEVFRKFCCNAIANIGWKKQKIHGNEGGVYPWGIGTKPPEKDWLERWTNYAVRGWLSDVIEIHMKVLKIKPENEREEIV